VGFVQSCAGIRLHQKCRPNASCGPVAAGIVERIVDPRQRALLASEVVYRLQFPVRTGFAGVAFELQKRQISGQSDPLRQVIIGFFLPTGAPNKLEMIA